MVFFLPPPFSGEGGEHKRSEMRGTLSPLKWGEGRTLRHLHFGVAEHDLAPTAISGSGKDGRVTKEDVLAFIATQREKSSIQAPKAVAALPTSNREERRVPMSRLRAKIAERLLDAQHNAAMLTTFNEVNLKEVMALR